PRVTHPFAAVLGAEAPFSLDLHVLGAPPAFVLSQDQTLQRKLGELVSSRRLKPRTLARDSFGSRRSRREPRRVPLELRFQPASPFALAIRISKTKPTRRRKRAAL